MLEKMGSYRKDIQWINGLFFVLFLTNALLIGGVARLMTPEIAKPMLVSLFKSSLPETNSIKNFPQTRKNLSALSPKAHFKFPDIPAVGVTAGDAAKLNAQGFVSKVSNDIAFRIYEGGTTAFNPVDQPLIGPLANINRANHKKISIFGNGIWSVAIFFGLIMFIFGKRYGRVFSLGLAVMVATFLPMIVFKAAVSAVSNPSTDPKAGLYSAIYAGVTPAVLESQQYAIKFFYLSLLLMVSAAIGRIAYSLTASLRESREAQDGADSAVKSKGVHQTRLLELQLPYDKLFDLCIASLDRVQGTVKEEDRALGKLTAKIWRGMSKYFKPSSQLVETLFGIGETIRFELFKINDESTRVQISSDPSVWTVKFDFGKNRQNVERISDFLLTEELHYKASIKVI